MAGLWQHWLWAVRVLLLNPWPPVPSFGALEGADGSRLLLSPGRCAESRPGVHGAQCTGRRGGELTASSLLAWPRRRDHFPRASLHGTRKVRKPGLGLRGRALPGSVQGTGGCCQSGGCPGRTGLEVRSLFAKCLPGPPSRAGQHTSCIQAVPANSRAHI